MTYYSPQLIQTMRDALDAVMTKVPMKHATPSHSASCRAGFDEPRCLGSSSIGQDSNHYLDAQLNE